MGNVEDFLGGAEGQKEKMVTTSISLPKTLLHRVEDEATRNKRRGTSEKSVSAVIRKALDEYFEI